jgi:nucleotide-binding universal stress UspA family protein
VTIVLGYDESPGSERALEVAIDLAATYDEPLVLVYGVAPPGVVGEEFRAHMAAVEELGRSATSHALARASAAGVRAEVELVHEKPAAALVDVADRRDARMIVVGSYGETPLRGVILGSTTYKVLNQSHRPVLVVKA